MLRWLTMAVVAVAMTAPTFANAQEEKTAPRREGRPGAGRGEGRGFGRGGADMAFFLPREITLSDEQKTKVDELKKEWTPKLEAAQKKVDDVLTEDQKKIRREQMEKFRDNAGGNRGREGFAAAREEMEKAINLTDDQKKAQAAAREEQQKLVRDAREKLTSILTDEQKKTLEESRNRRGRGEGGDRPRRPNSDNN